MSAAPTPSPQVSPDPPCRVQPERWFDRDDRGAALRGCLACPARGWCAREALRVNASWGMWAGVWIDGRRRDAIDQLRRVAAAPPPPVPLHPTGAELKHDVPQRRYASASPQALIAARSSGHCEVLLDGCRYSGGVPLSRGTGDPDPTPPSAAHGFLACSRCRTRLDQPARIATEELGYRVHSPTDVYTAPLFWRQTRWVILDPAGHLRTPDAADRQRAG